MTTYKKLTWDSYKIQVESAVRDGNGATISTTYATKTEVTTGLGTKLDTTVAASTYATQTALTDGLAAKADKATSLAGYGITDGVTTNTAQTITAEKTFKQSIKLLSDGTDPILEITSNYPRIIGHNPNNLNSSDGMYFQQIGYDESQINRYQMDGFRRGSASQTELHTYLRNNSNQLVDNGLFITDSNEGWMTAPYRTYNSANVNDVVTIGSLAANPSVIHATGNETISGLKTFLSGVEVQTGSVYDRLSALYVNSTYAGYDLISGNPNDSNNYGGIRVIFDQDNKTVTLELIKVVNGSYSATLIASL